MQRLVLLVTILVGACSGPPRAIPPATARASVITPRAFVDRMLGALEATDQREWSALLSSRVRTRIGTDPGAIGGHLAAWRRDLLPLAHDIRRGELALDGTNLTYALDDNEPNPLAVVIVEGGSLRLDEN